MRCIDVHSHFIPLEFIEAARRDPSRLGVRVVQDASGSDALVHDQGYSYPVPPRFYDLEARRADMRVAGLDSAVLSVSPTLFYYWAEAELAAEVARLCNDAAAALVRQDPEHFWALATVPLQDVSLAVRELERAVGRLGLHGVEIGSILPQASLSDPRLDPFWRLVSELDLPVLVHPYYVGTRRGMERFYLTNLVGNPFETTLSLADAACGGLLERFPGLKLIFVHAGGAVPYILGRLDHGHRVRPETRAAIVHPPSRYVRQVYFDTITHFGPALQYLVDTFGSDRVLLGSDYPFDMADPDPVGTVSRLRASPEQLAAVSGGNALRLIKSC
ncbi:MAG: amidohydrolase [Acetobacteraceae bacterium]|nr:amidohydrolase [Acetobacteraceae bacterium]